MPRISSGRVQLAYDGTLVGCVNQDPRCVAKLKEATDLALSLFYTDTIRTRYQVYEKLRPFATEEHLANVEEKLDEIVYGCCDPDNGMPENCFLPTPFEAMILLAAARLRTIGLLWGLFRHERVKTEGFLDTIPSVPCWLDPKEQENHVITRKVQEFIRTFANRSARYIRHDWRLFCSWSEAERKTLATILDNYFPGKDTKVLPTNFNGCDVRKLTELLRLATCTTMTPGMCPLEIRLELKPDEICDDRNTHLAVSKFISGIHFHHGLSRIEIVAASPRPIPIYARNSPDGSLPIVTLDYRSGLEFFASVVQSVVDSVSPYLNGCTNTRFSLVELICIELEGLPENAEVDAFVYLPDHWCHVLLTASNASEVAAMVLLILKSFCKPGFYDRDSAGNEIEVNFVEQVNAVLISAERLHPFNESVRKLVVDIRSWMKWDRQPNVRQRDLFLREIENKMDILAESSELAANECISSNSLKDSKVRDFDVVLLHRYSRSVMTTLVKSKFKGHVLIVEMEEDRGSPWIQHEGERIEALLKHHQIQFNRVSVGTLPSELSRLRFDEKTFVLMLGTRCILHDSEDVAILTHLGTRSLVATVRDLEGKVLVVTGLEKATSEEHICNEYRSKVRNVRRTAKPWTHVDALSLRKHVDVMHMSPFSTLQELQLHIFDEQDSETMLDGVSLSQEPQLQRAEGRDDKVNPRIDWTKNSVEIAISAASIEDDLRASQQKFCRKIESDGLGIAEIQRIPEIIAILDEEKSASAFADLPVKMTASATDVGGWVQHMSRAVAMEQFAEWGRELRQGHRIHMGTGVSQEKSDALSFRRQMIRNESLRCAMRIWGQSCIFVFAECSAASVEEFLTAFKEQEIEFKYPLFIIAKPEDEFKTVWENLQTETSMFRTQFCRRNAAPAYRAPANELPSLRATIGYYLNKDVIKAKRNEPRGINRIVLQDIGPFEHFDVSLHPRINVFLGNNSTGKTTILRAACLPLCDEDKYKSAAANFVRSRPGDKYNQSIRTSWVEIEIAGANQRVNLRKEGRQVVIDRNGEPLIASGMIVAIGFSAVRGVRSANPTGPNSSLIDDWPCDSDLLPLVNSDLDSRLSNIKQWIVNLEFQARLGSDSGNAAKRIRDLFFGIIHRIQTQSEIQFLRVDDQSFDIILSVDGIEVPLELLSQGLISTFGWIGYLVMRLFQLYPDAANPHEEYALVLVDEIDSHLHPAWQRVLLPVLMDVFKKVQFVVSTHSPFVAMSCSAVGKCFKIERRGAELTVSELGDNLVGAGVNGVLTSEYFGLATALDVPTELLLDEHTRLSAIESPTEEQSERLRSLSMTIEKLGFESGLDDPRFAAYLKEKSDQLQFNKDWLSDDESKIATKRLQSMLKEIQESIDE